MKKTIKYVLGVVLALGFTQCDLETEIYDQIPTEDAFASAQDVENAMNGAYEKFGGYRFYGNYAVAISDMITDVSKAAASSGHFVTINNWAFDEYSTELGDMWEYGYKILDWCTRGIVGGGDLIEKGGLTQSDLNSVNSSLSQMYSLRAMSSFVLVSYFGLPYRAGTANDDLGIVLLTTAPIDAFAQVSRSTVGETYTQILADIAQAKAYMDKSDKDAIDQYYFNEAAIYALEARVKINMQDYADAKTAAQSAIDLRNSADETAKTYVSMWSKTDITNEDIFTIVKSEDDNLSANSLNTLYDNYGGTLTAMTTGLFTDTDIRTGLIDGSRGLKFAGLASSAAVSNIPVFRKSEMYLIIAECNLRQATPDIAAAQEALFYTAKRDPETYKTVADLPATKDALLQLVQDENIREFFQEGHRWNDLRREGTLATIAGHENYDLSNFVLPIPGDEINSGFGVEQNENWYDAEP